MIKKLLSVFMMLCLHCGIVSAQELTLGNIHLTQNQNTVYQLKKEDIVSALADSFPPDSITITKLPPITSATLTKNGQAIPENTIVSISEVTQLSLTPTTDFLGKVTFSFSVTSGTRVSNEADFTVEYIAVQKAPVLSDLYYGTEKNIARELPLYPATYNGHLRLTIPTPPAHGTLTAKDENYHTVIYTPDRDFVGQDSFTYQEMGNADNVATVTVTVTESVTPLPAFAHEDLKNHWVNYSAGNLADRGILHGEMVGGKYYFHPDHKMTRWEYLNYLLASGGFNLDTAETGYADRYEDAQYLPEYIRKIAALATQMEILDGVREGEHLYIHPYQELTRAQAATMLGKMITSEIESEDKLYFSDRDEIPSWARKHIINLVNFGIMQGFPDNTIRPYSPLNKAQTAEMLYQAIKLTEKEPEILRDLKHAHQYYK